PSKAHMLHSRRRGWLQLFQPSPDERQLLGRTGPPHSGASKRQRLGVRVGFVMLSGTSKTLATALSALLYLAQHVQSDLRSGTRHLSSLRCPLSALHWDSIELDRPTHSGAS